MLESKQASFLAYTSPAADKNPLRSRDSPNVEDRRAVDRHRAALAAGGDSRSGKRNKKKEGDSSLALFPGRLTTLRRVCVMTSRRNAWTVRRDSRDSAWSLRFFRQRRLSSRRGEIPRLIPLGRSASVSENRVLTRYLDCPIDN